VSRWPVAGPSEYGLLASSSASKVTPAKRKRYPLTLHNIMLYIQSKTGRETTNITSEHLMIFTLAPVFYKCCQLDLGVSRIGDNTGINIPHFLSVNILLISGLPIILPSKHTSASGSFTTLRGHVPYFCILHLLLFSTLNLIKSVTNSSPPKSK
jgi:hypothetical protein